MTKKNRSKRSTRVRQPVDLYAPADHLAELIAVTVGEPGVWTVAAWAAMREAAPVQLWAVGLGGPRHRWAAA